MFESILTLIIATSVLLGSPGPAPLVLAATSASFGIKKTLPFLFGILAGLAVVILGSIFGIAVVLETYPKAKLFIQIIGSCYLLFVAFKIAQSPIVKSKSNSNIGIPSIVDGFILNLLNPKAYAAFFAIFSQFLIPLGSTFASYTLTAIVSFIVAIIIDFIWVLLGATLKRVFENEKQAKMIRLIFAIVIVLMVVVSFTLV
ncbi:MAG: threonine/homoserine/homoserine lactone efflux protein [Polaribacter sp.]|jgi:threonine/homoserine/homoserine lactone efflux protein